MLGIQEVSPVVTCRVVRYIYYTLYVFRFFCSLLPSFCNNSSMIVLVRLFRVVWCFGLCVKGVVISLAFTLDILAHLTIQSCSNLDYHCLGFCAWCF